MSGVNLRTVCAAGLVTAGLLALQPGGMPTGRAATCPDVDVVFARGTSEPAGIGRVGQAFADSLQSLIPGRTVTTYPVNYPASYDFLTAQDGAIDASQHIRSMVQQCPATRIVLGGYSQGAAVIDMLVDLPPLGNKIGGIGSGAPLAGDLASNVAAVAVFGNPAAKFGNPVTSAGPPYGGRAMDMCKDGDPICSRGRNPFAHNGYETSDFIPQAAGFVAGFV
jgi:cutinase